MRKLIFSVAVIGAFFCQSVIAVHPLPQIPNSCAYSLATPHRPDPRSPTLDTPEERCYAADTFALSNVPTYPADVITPSGEPRYYCTLDGAIPAIPTLIEDEDLASELTGATSCAGDAVCQDLFGEDASCEAFANDASGFGDNGWVSVGPAGAITVAGDLAGSLGVHSIYVRGESGNGHIFYFGSGVFRTHSLTAPGEGSEAVLDITFCKAPNSPVTQRAKPPESVCTGFFCLPRDCCGPHFPCDEGDLTNLPPLLQEPGARIAGLDLEIEAGIDSGQIGFFVGSALRLRLIIINYWLDNDLIEFACSDLRRFERTLSRQVAWGWLDADVAGPLEAEAVAIQNELGCN